LKNRHTIWVEIVLVAGTVYALALMYQMINEHFDNSPPTTEQTSVIEKRLRYNPIPINVLTVRNASDVLYDVDVLDELAEKVSAGTRITVVHKPGFFGKRWVQDKDFHDVLSGMRTPLGFVYLAIAGLLAVCWFFVAKKRFKSASMATASLIGALVFGFGIFWVLP
jgi:hypothetical protein